MRFSSLLILTSLFLLSGPIVAQTVGSSEIRLVSKYVGATIDIPEQTYYQIFDNVDGFISAQFREIPNGFGARIRTRRGYVNRAYTERAFYDMALAVDLMGPIDPDVLFELTGEPAFFWMVDSIRNIPLGVRMVLLSEDRAKFSGRYQGFDKQFVLLKGRRDKISKVPLSGMETIKYREHPIAHLEKDVRIHVAFALLGMAGGVGWNILWNVDGFNKQGFNLFAGGLAGAAVSPFPVKVGRKYRAPVRKIDIPVEIQDKIRTYTYLTFD